MSEKPATDLNRLHEEAGRMKESSSNRGMMNTVANNVDEILQENGTHTTASILQMFINGNAKLNSEAEAVDEVEDTESECLNDVEDLDMSLKTLLAGLDSRDWVFVCSALNDVRRLSKFHKESMLDMLENVISLIVKSLRNPRSAVCKTALIASADIFKAYSENIVDSMDPLLMQILLKSSQDKRFVCEAAQRALIAMTTSVSPLLLLPKLQPYLKNRNPRIRAKALMCFSRSVPQLGDDGIRAYGIEKLIEIGASQLSDQLPESREAARALLFEVRSVYEKNPESSSWEGFCQSKLAPLNAQAVVRATNVS